MKRQVEGEQGKEDGQLHTRARHVRLGHALGDRGRTLDQDALQQVIALARGETTLIARQPEDPEAVGTAEDRVVPASAERPIYAYVGDLHPALGSVGLIFERAWSRRCLQGVSRCDTGGLAAGRGAFAQLEEPEDRKRALDALSSPVGLCVDEWEADFDDEVQSSYRRGARGYVEGDRPDTSTWRQDDVRRQLLDRLEGHVDRRLWTWEARMDGSPCAEELVAIVAVALSGGILREQRRLTRSVPDTVRMIIGHSRREHIDHDFQSSAVRNLLLGYDPQGEAS